MHVYVSGSFSVYDFIGNMCGCTTEQARHKFKVLRTSGHVPDKPLPGVTPR